MPWSHTRENGEFFRKFYLNRPQWLFFYPFICANLSPLSANFTSSEQLSETGRPHLRNYKTPIRNLTNILENFINRAYYVYKFNPCRSEEPSISGKNHGRKKKKKEKKKLLSKLAASLARKSLRAQFSRPIETRFRPIHPPPSSPPLFPSRGKRLLIRARRTSALLAGRRRGGEERVLRVRAARGRTQGWTHSMHRRGEREREGGTRSWKWGAAIDPAALVRRNGKWPFGKLHSPPSAFRLLSPRSAARGMRRLSGFFASFILLLLSYVLCLQARDGRFVLRFEYDFSFFKNPKSRFIILTRNESLIHAELEERWTWATGVTYTGLRHL